MPPASSPLTHSALCYSSPEEYRDGVVPFIEAGLALGEPTLAFAMPPNLDVLREGLKGAASLVTVVDAPSNPSCIIPAARRFAEAHPGQPIRLVGEPGWPGRAAAAFQEVVRHEALVNLLLADLPATILCPYSASELDTTAIENACRTHPHVVQDGHSRPSSTYVDPLLMLAKTHDLSEVPGDARSVTHRTGDLAALRHLVRSFVEGLGSDRVEDVLVAVTEAAANTHEYTIEPGTLRLWRTADAMIVEVSDVGHIPEVHLAGRIAPPLDAPRGRGLWIINQVCDLVELRSSAAGTVTRMHFALA